jgi:hypothetical protein
MKLWGIWGIIYLFSINFPMRKRLETLGKTLRFCPKYPKRAPCQKMQSDTAP